MKGRGSTRKKKLNAPTPGPFTEIFRSARQRATPQPEKRSRKGIQPLPHYPQPQGISIPELLKLEELAWKNESYALAKNPVSSFDYYPYGHVGLPENFHELPRQDALAIFKECKENAIQQLRQKARNP